MNTDKNIIHGYKAFASDGTNIALEIMPPGTYHFDGPIKYGKSGYHFAEKLEDTIRYSGTDTPLIAEVIATGVIDEGFDEYNGYYEVYTASDIKIIRYLSREEIIEYALNLNDDRMQRFITGFELSNDELDLFVQKNKRLEKTIQAYEIRQKIKKKDLKKFK